MSASPASPTADFSFLHTHSPSPWTSHLLVSHLTPSILQSLPSQLPSLSPSLLPPLLLALLQSKPPLLRSATPSLTALVSHCSHSTDDWTLYLSSLLSSVFSTPTSTHTPDRITATARRVQERLQTGRLTTAPAEEQTGLVLQLPSEHHFLDLHQLPAFLTRPHPFVEPSLSAPQPLALVAAP